VTTTTTTPTYQYAYILDYDPPHLDNTITNVLDNPSYFSFSGATAKLGEVITFVSDNVSEEGRNTYSGYTDSAGYPIVISEDVAYLLSDEVLSVGSVVSQIYNDSFACYLAGTRIAVPDGEIEVEHLREGMLVVTASGAHRPVHWIGRRSFKRRAVMADPRVRPVILTAGCLGEALPRRDLRVSRDHAMFLDGVLIPAYALVNGVTIRIDPNMDEVHYFHIELDSHDVILAEGAPSESFVDDNSRGAFHNAAEYKPRVPAPPAAIYCAPRHEHGWLVESVHARLARLAGIQRAA